MDSLLATYASSDEDDGDQHPSAPTHPLPSPSPSPSPFPSPSLFSSLSAPPAPPKNKSSSSSSTSSSLFSLLPPPKFGKATKLDPPTSNSNPSKKVVFLKPTWASPDLGSDDDDEEGEKKAKARKNQFSTVSGSNALSLPPPKYSFSAAPSSSGRRALIESNTAAPASVAPPVAVEKVETASYGEKSASLAVDAADTANYGYYPVDGSAETAASSGVDGAAGADYGYYAADGSADYYPDSGVDGYGAGYAQHGGEWGKAVVVDSAPAADFVFGDGRRGKGKRGRNEVPLEVMEVKQDELMKNRPREDQSKMTGIAFGPGYQPVSSAKGKPNKLHKRKHQIGSLYFDMKQKEMELAERRSRGFQTKAETQGKYGW